jgi:hypothetical protein
MDEMMDEGAYLASVDVTTVDGALLDTLNGSISGINGHELNTESDDAVLLVRGSMLNVAHNAVEAREFVDETGDFIEPLAVEVGDRLNQDREIDLTLVIRDSRCVLRLRDSELVRGDVLNHVTETLKKVLSLA